MGTKDSEFLRHIRRHGEMSETGIITPKGMKFEDKSRMYDHIYGLAKMGPISMDEAAESVRRGDSRMTIAKEELITNVTRMVKLNEELLDLYSKKNKDYGNSFDKSLDADGLLVAKIRLGDKLSRFSQLINNPIEVSDESLRDTLVDLANYAKMTVLWLDEQEEEVQPMKQKVTEENYIFAGGMYPTRDDAPLESVHIPIRRFDK